MENGVQIKVRERKKDYECKFQKKEKKENTYVLKKKLSEKRMK